MPFYENSPANILSKRRSDAINAADARSAELHEKLPQTEEIDRQLGEIAYRSFVSAGDAQTLCALKAKRDELQRSRDEILVSAGYPAEYDEPRFKCNKCRDTGYIKLEKCECLKELEAASYNNTELGAGLAGCTFDTFSLEYYSDAAKGGRSEREVMEEILGRCRVYCEYFNEHSGNLLFCGGTGLGKTHLSAAIGHEVAKKGHSVVYESAQKIVSDCRRALYSSATEAADIYYDCTLLIIDDLGAEVPNDYSVSALTELINRRMVLGKPIIISTNLELKKIGAVYGSRLFSRIIGGFIPCVFTGTDIRYKKLK
ncbi:MAG: ATP-binding protein [Clostridia bacterium]|nr:ATP-binding protein [Clostridia bacterium]